LASIKTDLSCRCPHLSSPKPLHAEFGPALGGHRRQDGNIYVADWNNHRVQKLSPEGRFLMKFGVYRKVEDPEGTPMG
jgi:hypothetical protein